MPREAAYVTSSWPHVMRGFYLLSELLVIRNLVSGSSLSKLTLSVLVSVFPISDSLRFGLTLRVQVPNNYILPQNLY